MHFCEVFLMTHALKETEKKKETDKVTTWRRSERLNTTRTGRVQVSLRNHTRTHSRHKC